MPLVVPGVARFTVNQTLQGRAVVNVLDYFIDTTGSTMSRADAVAGQAGSIVEQWAARILPRQVNELTFDSVSYVDMDDANGVTGSVVTGGSYVLPDPGGTAGDPMPGNVALLVTKQGPSRRGFRNGRMFIGGISETITTASNGNAVDSGAASAWNTALAGFLADTNELDSLGTAFSSNMVIVHVTERDGAGNPTLGESTEVESLVVDGTLATQRRRLRG